jgi:outer membrane protein assembly factor BamA
VIFDLQDPDHPNAHLGPSAGHLRSQTFEGAPGLAADDLAAATGLKQGDTVSREKIDAAHRALVALLAKSTPGKAVSIRVKARMSDDNAVTLTWIVGAP